MRRRTYRSVLSIAGSDSVGGAGIQADMKTCSALGVYGMTAVTAVTAQNTMGVRGVWLVDPEGVRAQIEAVMDDIRPDAVKIGMIPDAGCAEAIADCLERYAPANVVVDPVMVATSGDALSTGSVLETMRRRLFALSDLITPNLPEASAILGREADEADEAAVLELLAATGAGGVLLKGGHAAGEAGVSDRYALRSMDGSVELRHPFVDSRNTHGTGCSLSSAIACFLALGLDMADAIRAGVEAVGSGIAAGRDYDAGHGHGSINHFAMEKFRTI